MPNSDSQKKEPMRMERPPNARAQDSGPKRSTESAEQAERRERSDKKFFRALRKYANRTARVAAIASLMGVAAVEGDYHATLYSIEEHHD